MALFMCWIYCDGTGMTLRIVRLISGPYLSQLYPLLTKFMALLHCQILVAGLETLRNLVMFVNTVIPTAKMRRSFELQFPAPLSATTVDSMETDGIVDGGEAVDGLMEVETEQVVSTSIDSDGMLLYVSGACYQPVSIPFSAVFSLMHPSRVKLLCRLGYLQSRWMMAPRNLSHWMYLRCKFFHSIN